MCGGVGFAYDLGAQLTSLTANPHSPLPLVSPARGEMTFEDGVSLWGLVLLPPVPGPQFTFLEGGRAVGCWPGALPSLQAHDGPRSPLPPAVSHLPLPGGHTAHQQGKARPVTEALLLGEPPGSSWPSCLNRLHKGAPPRGLRPPETPGGPRQRPLSEPRQALPATALARLPCPGEGAEEGRRPASQPPTAGQARAWGLGGDQPQGTRRWLRLWASVLLSVKWVSW